MKILFSPVGGTDPISMDTYRDGSMLHIIRVYKPEKIILYMSNEILNYHHNPEDNRYLYCIEKLSELIGIKPQVEVIERPELTNVHEFNYFYEDYSLIVKHITDSMNKEDELLLNVSSGTPAMKSALLVIKTLIDYPCKLIQVSTPIKKMNNHNHDEYNVQDAWECDDDNNDFQNRCSEIECPNLKKIKYEEIIKKHILAYDYQAALRVAKELDTKSTEKYIELLNLAANRLLLNQIEVNRLINETGVEVIPVKREEARKHVEYALNVDIKVKKKEYADFLRAISPLLLDLFILILKEQCNVDINKYLRKNRKGIDVWDEDKLTTNEKGQKILSILNNRFENFKFGNVYSIQIMSIIQELSSDKELHILLESVRSIEENARNFAAHEIISIDNDYLLKKTGYSAEQIMNMIKKLFNYVGFILSKDVWNSYDDMNESIIKAMVYSQEN